jgi:hypothetical protein
MSMEKPKTIREEELSELETSREILKQNPMKNKEDLESFEKGTLYISETGSLEGKKDTQEQIEQIRAELQEVELEPFEVHKDHPQMTTTSVGSVEKKSRWNSVPRNIAKKVATVSAFVLSSLGVFGQNKTADSSVPGNMTTVKGQEVAKPQVKFVEQHLELDSIKGIAMEGYRAVPMADTTKEYLALQFSGELQGTDALQAMQKMAESLGYELEDADKLAEAAKLHGKKMRDVISLNIAGKNDDTKTINGRVYGTTTVIPIATPFGTVVPTELTPLNGIQQDVLELALFVSKKKPTAEFSDGVTPSK